MCGRGVQCLVISGEVEEGILLQAWESILSEYSTLIKTPKADSVFMAYQRMVSSKWRMSFMELAVGALKDAYTVPIYLPNVCEQVALLGYDYIEDPVGNWEHYGHQVEAIETESKSLIVFFNQAKAEYELLAPKGVQRNEERDRMSYEMELQLLTKFRGSHIDDETITLFRYAGIVNLYLESLKKDQA
jgi:hypothetical protein